MKDDTLLFNIKIIVLMCIVFSLLWAYVTLKESIRKIRLMATKLWHNRSTTGKVKQALALS